MFKPYPFLIRICVLLTLCGAVSAATEFFVAPDGCDDTHDGLGRVTAFASVQRGVDALEPGDTLTILPGEYFGPVRRAGLGGDEALTTIRADIPGTAVLRGDTPAPAFRKADGYHFVYVADFEGEPQVVNELDTNTVFERQPDLALLEFIPGSFHHDQADGKLYMSTSNLKAPGDRRYTLSVVPTHGLHLKDARRVVVEGLAVTGFNTAELIGRGDGSFNGAWGIFLYNARHCIVRDCRVWLNGQGIGINSSSETSGDNVIERCVSWSNASRQGTGDRGGLTLFFPRRDTIRDSIAYHNDHLGINMYHAAPNAKPEDGNSFLSNNLTWGNRPADIKIKAGPLSALIAERNVGLGLWSLRTPQHCLAGIFRGEYADNNIMVNMEAPFDFRDEFADPDNLDFRLQADSRFRGTAAGGADRGPFPYVSNIFYVHPDGDDTTDGLSSATAWRTLQRGVKALSPGDTLYLEGGPFAATDLEGIKGDDNQPVAVRGRGRAPVVISGPLTIRACRGLQLKRLTFKNTLSVIDSEDVVIENCAFNAADIGLIADSVTTLSVTHSEFSNFNLAGIDLTHAANVHLTGNLFANQRTVAIRANDNQTPRHSDYNSFGSTDRIRQIGDASLDLQQVRGIGQERHSTLMEPEFTSVDGFHVLANRAAFATLGPHGKPAGMYHKLPDTAEALNIAGPFAYAIDDTTANIEWYASAPCAIRLDWGTTPAMENSVSLDAHRFGSFSLTDLEPGTKYHLRLTPEPNLEPRNVEGLATALRFRNLRRTLDRTIVFLDSENATHVTDESIAMTFQTAMDAAQPQVYYVTPQGHDQQDGLSRERAWRTVQHAANRARPGDTVFIGAGTYRESVRVRATGSRERPISFRAIPGERVVFDGVGRALPCAFYITNKAWLNFDGFYFTGYGHLSAEMPWSDTARGNNAIFTLYRTDDVRITRCFHDGRGPGTSPGLLQAVFSSNILLRNCVAIRSMGGGIQFVGAPGLRVENNVFLRSEISHVGDGVNEPGQPFYLVNNIFTDNLPKKVNAPLFAVGKIESLVESGNCYYLRLPETERNVFMFYEPEPAYGNPARAWGLATEFDDPPVITERAMLTLPEYIRRYNPDSGSVVVDPGFRGAQELDRIDRDGLEITYFVDLLMAQPELDFPDLFITHPDLIERGIGLQPEAFADFHFNQR